MSEFCRQHAYYDPCPVCAGVDSVWVIPIEDSNGVQTGEMRLTESGQSEVVGTLMVPWEKGATVFTPPLTPAPRERRFPVPQGATANRQSSRRAPSLLDHEPPDPELGARLQRELDPRYQEAIAKGRKVHDDALALSEERGITYAEAIKLVIE